MSAAFMHDTLDASSRQTRHFSGGVAPDVRKGEAHILPRPTFMWKGIRWTLSPITSGTGSTTALTEKFNGWAGRPVASTGSYSTSSGRKASCRMTPLRLRTSAGVTTRLSCCTGLRFRGVGKRHQTVSSTPRWMPNGLR